MRPIAPRTGEPEITLAEEQHDYLPITAAVRMRPVGQSLVTRWTLTPAERAAVANGADVFVETLTFGAPMQPVAVSIGGLDE